MSKSLRGPLLLGGALLIVISALADTLGIGQPGFGFKQIGGVIVGIVAILVGAVGWNRGRREDGK